MTGVVVAAVGQMLADPWGGGHMGGGAWMWLWVPLSVVVLVGIAALVGVMVARGGTPRQESVPPERRAREILMERYARGEIDSEEYEERSARLR